MPHFPQLSTGCLAQYPFRILHRRRAVVNESMGGERFTSFDAFTQGLEWDLPYRGLSTEESANLRELFETCEGRRGEFLFADPSGNLLKRSEQFNQAPWVSDPQLAWTGGVDDPHGGHAAMHVQNNSGLTQAFKQTVMVPASYETCFSVWAKSSSAGEVVVRRTSGPEAVTAAIPLGGEWRRIETAAVLTGTTVGVELAVEIPGTAAVEFFAAQMEAQKYPSGYKRTLADSGIYPAARFAQDELIIEADGFQTFATRVRIIAQLAG
jgi:hypothetical protein